MIRLARKSRLRDPQIGVPFRAAMLVHGGSIGEIASRRIDPIAADPAARRGGLVPWTLAMAGLVAAFFLGMSWSAAPRPSAADACLATAPEPAADSTKDAGARSPR